MGNIRSAALVVFSFALVVAGFQNCSEPMQPDNLGSNTVSSLSTPTPTPVPLSGTYSPNPATVGTTITISGINGQPPYTYVKTAGNGTLTGQHYAAPATAETATITVVDNAGRSFPLSIPVYVATPTPSPTPAASPTPRPTRPVYRFYSGLTIGFIIEHFFTLDQNEGTAKGFTPEGIGFYVYTQFESGMTTLYRCQSGGTDARGGGKHFVSVAPNCEGFTNEGTYGYVYTTQVAGTVPLYRVRSLYDYMATKDQNEGQAAGYSLESTLGYVPQ